MNATYYYEITPGTTLFGTHSRYWVQPKFDPQEPGWPKTFHTEAWRHSVNIWIENSNGVTQIMNNRRECFIHVPRHELDSLKEFVWMKIQAEVVPE